MNGSRGWIGRLFSAGLLGLVLLPFPWSCQRRSTTSTTPPPPPPPNYFEIGETAFEAGNYRQAIDAYNAYLRATPDGTNADRALFRMAMAHALPESPALDTSRSVELLEELVFRYPDSLFRSPAEVLLRQQRELTAERSQVERLRADLNRQESQIQTLTQELDRTRQADQMELERLRADLSRREERVRQLTVELEKLKQIDLQRRPPAPLP
jgi:outer membrane protein assembly factor BamD (BamD/ComL family)